MTGETMRHEAVEPPDEDYLDPHYLHTAAEIYEMPTGQDVEFESGQNFDPFAGENCSVSLDPGLPHSTFDMCLTGVCDP